MKSPVQQIIRLGVLAVGLSTVAVSADAAPGKTISGTSGQFSYKAASRIVGQTSTATLAAGGSPLNFATGPRYSGTVALLMDYGPNVGRFVCSGSLASDRRSIVTAAHCVSGGAGTANPLSTTAFFYGGPDPDVVLFQSPLATAVSVDRYIVNPNYTGEVIDQNDIAVLTLSQFAPDFATSYDLFDEGDLTGDRFNVAGIGQRSDVGGLVGANLGTGRKRQGDNRFDFRLGDGDFDGFFTDADANGERFFGTADVDFSFLSDFDPGRSSNDASCLLAGAFGLGGAKYCNLGVGALEVNVAGGDSGGPQFIDGRLAAVTSYGLSFGADFGDIDEDLNSSWGEFSGYVPTYIHRDFLLASFVPEPATWAMMIVGLGMIGGSLRRRRPDARTAAIAFG